MEYTGFVKYLGSSLLLRTNGQGWANATVLAVEKQRRANLFKNSTSELSRKKFKFRSVCKAKIKTSPFWGDYFGSGTRIRTLINWTRTSCPAIRRSPND